MRLGPFYVWLYVDLTGQGDTPISRRKSFKKSLRESFRRLRKGRSTRRNPASSPTSGQTTSPPARKPGDGENFSPLEAKPIERQIEARPVDDAMGSMVRCLYFARTFIVSGKFCSCLFSAAKCLFSSEHDADPLGGNQQWHRLRVHDRHSRISEARHRRRRVSAGEGDSVKAPGASDWNCCAGWIEQAVA